MMAFGFCDDVWPRNNEKCAHPEERKERLKNNLTATTNILLSSFNNNNIITIEIEIDQYTYSVLFGVHIF